MGAATATGSIRPALGGAPVQLQRQEGTAWRTIGAAITDARGAFSVAGDSAPGSYRVRVAPGAASCPASRRRSPREAARPPRRGGRGPRRTRRRRRHDVGGRVASLPGAETLLPGRAVAVESPTRPRVPGAAFVERLDRKRRLAFDNTEPLASRQWYLHRSARWTSGRTPPKLSRPASRSSTRESTATTRSSRAGRRGARASSAARRTRTTTATGRSSRARSPRTRRTRTGIAGIAVDARLVIAKVVQRGRLGLAPRPRSTRSGGRSTGGARVINLSLGGVRDPFDPKRRHVLAARAGSGRLRVVQGRRDRGGGRQRPAVADARRGTTRTTRPRSLTSSA